MLNTYTLLIYSTQDGGVFSRTLDAASVPEACDAACISHAGGSYKRDEYELVAAIEGTPTWAGYAALPINEFPGA